MMTPAGFEPDISWLRTRNPEPLDEGAKEKTACHGKIRNRRLSDNIPYTVCILAGQGILPPADHSTGGTKLFNYSLSS